MIESQWKLNYYDYYLGMKIFGAKNVEYFVRKRTDWCKLYLRLKFLPTELG
jgi:hypothetical protein